jgi:hypothetical protein
VLKLGSAPTSVVAAFLGFLFLRIPISAAAGTTTAGRTTWSSRRNSAAQTAFMCILLGAFDLLNHNTNGARHQAEP